MSDYPKSGAGFGNHWTLDGPERWPGLRVECERYVDTFIKGRSPAEWPAAFFAFAGYVIGHIERTSIDSRVAALYEERDGHLARVDAIGAEIEALRGEKVTT